MTSTVTTADLFTPTEELVECAFCGNELPEEDMQQTRQGDPGCDRCLTLCDICSEYAPRGETEEYRHDTWCEGCASEYLGWCEGCGERLDYESDDTYSNDYGSYHEACYSDGDGDLEDWNAQPSLRLIGDAPYHFGVEVELEHASEHASKFRDTGAVICKSDSSLEYGGMEVVSSPGSLDAWQQGVVIDWNRWAAAAENIPDQRQFKSNGIHVHVSRTAFLNERTGRQSTAHLYSFIQLVQQNAGPIQKLAGRGSSTYCEWSAVRDRQGAKSEAEGGTYGDRYRPINLQNDDTVELRFFDGRKSKGFILASVELVHAMVEYTRTMTSKNVKEGAWHWPQFSNYISANRDRYPNLDSRVTNTGDAELVEIFYEDHQEQGREIDADKERRIEQDRLRAATLAALDVSPLSRGREAASFDWYDLEHLFDTASDDMRSLSSGMHTLVTDFHGQYSIMVRRYVRAVGSYNSSRIVMEQWCERLSRRIVRGWFAGEHNWSQEMRDLCTDARIAVAKQLERDWIEAINERNA